MMKGLPTVVLFAMLLLTAASIATGASAGGWATITLDKWPEGVLAGESFTVGFVVRQHGDDTKKMNGLSPTLTFNHATTGQSLTVDAKPGDGDGHYVAQVELSGDGEWTWSIQAFTMDQPMPPLTALPPQSAKAPAMSAQPIVWGLLSVGAVAILAAVALGRRRRTRWAVLAAVVGLALGGFGLAVAVGNPAISPAAQAASQPSAANRGQILFVAKGCVGCHANSNVPEELRPFSTELGPNLSDYTASPEFISLWLANPKAAKPYTQMPNLDLTEQEIDALAAFLTAK